MNQEQVLEALFTPNEHYIQLLKEFISLGYGTAKGPYKKNGTYNTVREELRKIERTLTADEIIRNTRIAFN